MRFVKFALTLALLILFWWVGGSHGLISPRIPALGKLLSPFNGFWQQAEPIRQDAQTVQLSLAGGTGEVLLDERGVPHIFAATLADAFFLQGYWHARHRLWQMDISVRATEGRLAEILGERLLERDRIQRRKGLPVAARRTIDAWKRNPQEFAWVEAYAAGINAYIESLEPADYPVEYKLMGFEPEAWTPYKSAVFMKSMAETLCFRSRDVESSNSRTLLGDSLFAHLFPEHNPQQSPVIPAGTSWDYIPNASEEEGTEEQLSGYFPIDPLPQSPEGIGSNNWAVAGSKTAGGNPILCNDPHLRLTLPSIWYEVQVHAEGINAYGVSLPGIPGIIIGFNEQVAWGLTNGSQDVLDWYRVQWTNESMTSYTFNGQERTTEWVTDTIQVRGQEEPYIERTPWTLWGPVVYANKDDNRNGLAMRWMALDEPQLKEFYDLGTFVGLMRAGNFEEYRAALPGFDSPIQNFVFAAQDGDIGLTVNGRMPIKRDQQGRFVEDGNGTQAAWQGMVSHAEMPYVRNPERGFVASANQRSTDLTYPYYYNGSFDDYRGRYINRRLEEMQQADLEKMKALQLDAHSLSAEEALPLLLAVMSNVRLDEEAGQVFAALSEWDYFYGGEATAPVYFEEWFSRAYKLTFDEIYTAAEAEEDKAFLYPERWRFIELLEQFPEDGIFDHQGTEEVEDARQILLQAFQEMIEEKGADWSGDTPHWADERATEIMHLGNIPGFGSGLLRMDGYSQSPNAISSRNGPSWRMIVELGEETEAWGVFPGGASGNPGSQYYDDGLDEWVAGEYFRLAFMKDAGDERFPVAARWTFE